MPAPSRNGANGRDVAGRFRPGTSGGPGNPHAARVGRLRSELLDALTPEDLRAVVVALVERAKAGDVAAAREVLDRALGRPHALDLEEDRLLTERAVKDVFAALVDLVRRRFDHEAADEMLGELNALVQAAPGRPREA